jgi:hypothetical protein
MRIAGTILMLVGGFVLIAAVLSFFGTGLRDSGIDIVGNVTSRPGAIVIGAILIVAGAWLRRRSPLRSAT